MRISEGLTLLLLMVSSTMEEAEGEEEGEEGKDNAAPPQQQLPPGEDLNDFWMKVTISKTLCEYLNDPGYCALDKPEYTARVRWIRRGFQKRVNVTL